MKIVAIVGMAGAGKSVVAKVFEDNGFSKIRFGDITDIEVERKGLELNEKNERYVRELLRQEHGMKAYAILNLPRIDRALNNSDVVIDGLYSWEEYTFLKTHYGKNLYLLGVLASPSTRYARLTSRIKRRLNLDEAFNRDSAEIEYSNKGGPIAMADFTVINESSLDNLIRQTGEIITRLK